MIATFVALAALVTGGALEAPRDHLSDAERAAIRQAIDRELERLDREGRLLPVSRGTAPLFGWPLRLAAGLDDPGYHGISNFVDHDPGFPDRLLDFQCGTRSYDTADGYNHQGTDFFTWPWSWRKMDRSEVEVVAAAPGQIVLRSDGNYDRNCGFGGGAWNAVYVRHADGSIAWYGHMKSGSLTGKAVGDTVQEGEYLGIVGSSGNSTGPHLHLEVYDAGDALIDPWEGLCNGLNPTSWWAIQPPYYDSAIVRVTTGDAAPVFPACPGAESPNARVTFGLGPLVYFTTYYRDQRQSQLSRYTVYRPNGSVYSQWTHSIAVPHYAASWWYWSVSIPFGEAQGTWRFTVEYEGTTVERLFTVGSPGACGRVPATAAEGQPLRAERDPAGVRLTWGASCNAQDTDYVVYEGAIGDFTSHAPVLCSTAGTRDVTIAPAAGGRYFLVTPRNAAREGSLGRSSAGGRPEGAAACVTRLALGCP